MHITKVIIEGFKSFKEKTIVEFSPGLNVVVGHNGAGKSNLFYAIQFVLAHQFQHLPQKKLAEMLHSSAGARVMSAFVEIIFDNKDKRLPDKDDEFRLRRAITSSKDVYTLNGQTITREKVIKTLQSAGLSKANPYYIIGQGKVREISTSSTEKCLAMLCEIAGSLIWTEVKPQDQMLLEDSVRRIDQLTHFQQELSERIVQLEQEEEEYFDWLQYDIKRRALLRLILQEDGTRYERKLLEAGEALKNEAENSKEAQTELNQLEQVLKTQQEEFKVKKSRSTFLEERLATTEAALLEKTLHRTKLEMEIEDIKLANESIEDPVERSNRLYQIKADIDAKSAEIENLASSIKETQQEHSTLNAQCMLNEQRRDHLIAKFGRSKRFRTKKERDLWINGEIEALEALLERGSVEKEKLNNEIGMDQATLVELTKNLEKLKFEESGTREMLWSNEERKKELEKELRADRTRRHDLWQEIHVIQDEKKQTRAAFDQIKSAFSKVASRDVYQGMESVWTIYQEMKKNNEEMADQYRGLVIEQFECTNTLKIAAEAIAKNRLFHHVVDTDQAATEILQKMTERKLSGSATFFAINRLQRKSCVDPPEDHPATSMMKPIVENLKKQGPVEERKLIVIEQLFSRVVLCQDLDSASETMKHMKTDGLTFVTLQGDVMRSGGAVSGGYFSPDSSRFKLYADYKKAQKEDNIQKNKLREFKVQLEEIESRISRNVAEYQQIETKIFRTKLNPVQGSLKSVEGQIASVRSAIEAKKKTVQQMESSLKSYEEKIGLLQKELGKPLAANSSDAAELQSVNDQIRTDNQSFGAVNEKFLQLEAIYVSLETELHNLVRLKEEFEMDPVRNIQDTKELTEELARLGAAIADLRRLVGNIQKEIIDLGDSIKEIEEAVDAWKEQRDVAYDRHNILKERVRNLQSNIDDFNRQLVRVRAEIADCGNFEELDAHQILTSYAHLNLDGLKRESKLVNNKLKGFKEVNQKASMEASYFKEILELVNKNLKKFSDNHDGCKDLMDRVDSKRDDALQYSLKTVAKNFKEVFRTIAHPGRGYLGWIYDDDLDMDDDVEEDLRDPDVSRLKGVSLNVTFDGKSKIVNMTCLSGGQQSIVSLALIFAILMMDRAPFYLLDEADMALDGDYRTKMAALVDRFSKSSQFIVTTFRPELLHHATNIIGLRFDANQSSRAFSVTKEEALEFIVPPRENGEPSESESSASTY